MARIQLNLGDNTKNKSDPGRSITLFLSLYLLVLAFFILLVSISTVEDIKSRALMQSLTSTFSSVLPPAMDLKAFNATTGDFLAADEFQRQVTGLFSTVIGVEKIEAIQPGRLMRVELDGNGLFEDDSEVVRENQASFMNRLVAALSSNPPGLRFEMEFISPVPWSENKMMPTDQTLGIRRAGAFARDLLSRGAPPGTLSIGMKGSESETLELWFHIRATEENRIRFEESPLIDVPEPEAEAEVIETFAPVTLQPIQNGGVSLELSPILAPSAQPVPQTPENTPTLLLPPSIVPSEPATPLLLSPQTEGQ